MKCEVYVPAHAADGVSVLVLMHGRGADRTDLFSLRHRLPADWAIVAPDAPFPAAPWGYGPGRAWYRYLGGTRPEEQSFADSLNAIDELLDDLPTILGVRPGAIALGGFSQGGTMSLGYALTRPGRVPHIVNLSGFLAEHPLVRVAPAAVKDARFFWGHGTADPAIPFAYAVAGREALRAAGADLEARDYPMGHGIDPSELEDLVAWLEQGVAS